MKTTFIKSRISLLQALEKFPGETTLLTGIARIHEVKIRALSLNLIDSLLVVLQHIWVIDQVTKQTWSIKDLLYGLWGNFPCETAGSPEWAR